jgi:hypothetical protein
MNSVTSTSIRGTDMGNANVAGSSGGCERGRKSGETVSASQRSNVISIGRRRRMNELLLGLHVVIFLFFFIDFLLQALP